MKAKPKLAEMDADELADYLNEFYEEMLEYLHRQPGMTKESNSEDFSFLWTSRGDRLALSLERRIRKIWARRFPDEGLDLYSGYYQEI